MKPPPSSDMQLPNPLLSWMSWEGEQVLLMGKSDLQILPPDIAHLLALALDLIGVLAPNFTQPNFTPPNFTQPNFTQPNFTHTHRFKQPPVLHLSWHAASRSRLKIVHTVLNHWHLLFCRYAIAYAVLQFLSQKIDCRLMFATHYHSLTVECSDLEQV